MWTLTPSPCRSEDATAGSRACVRVLVLSERVGPAGLLGAFTCASAFSLAALSFCFAPLSGLGLPFACSSVCLPFFFCWPLRAPLLSLAFSVFRPLMPWALGLCFSLLSPRLVFFFLFRCALLLPLAFSGFRPRVPWALALCVICFVALPPLAYHELSLPLCFPLARWLLPRGCCPCPLCVSWCSLLPLGALFFLILPSSCLRACRWSAVLTVCCPPPLLLFVLLVCRCSALRVPLLLSCFPPGCCLLHYGWCPPPPSVSRGFPRCRWVVLPFSFLLLCSCLLPWRSSAVLAVCCPAPLLLFVLLVSRCSAPRVLSLLLLFPPGRWLFPGGCCPPPPFCVSSFSSLLLTAPFLFLPLLPCSCLLSWHLLAVLAVCCPPPLLRAWCLVLSGVAALSWPSVGWFSVPCCRILRCVLCSGASPCCVVGCCALCGVCWGVCMCVVQRCWLLLRVVPCLWLCRPVGLFVVCFAVWFWFALPCAMLCCVPLGAVLRRAAARCATRCCAGVCCVVLMRSCCAPVHRCARLVRCFACAVTWATWLLFTGVPAWFVVLRLLCPGPLGSCSPVCALRPLLCFRGILGHLPPVHQCAGSMYCVACAVSLSSWLRFTGVLT